MDRTKTITFFLLIAIFLISVICQSSMYISWTVGWHLHLAQIFLNGGNYVTDFMDINPPILLYEFIPAVLLSKWTHLNDIIALRILIYIVIIVSLWLCAKMNNKLFNEDDSLTKAAFMIAIAIALLLAPAMEFGQQEHWVLIFTLPYLLSAILFATNQKTTKTLQVWSGIFAGLGFITNLFYLIMFIAVECYLAIKAQPSKSIRRPEPILILMITALYIASVFIVTPRYIDTVFPLSFILFFKEMRLATIPLLNNSTSITCLITIVLFPFHYKHTKTKCLYSILFIALIGFYIVFLFTHKAWYFHIIPTLSLSFLLLSLYLFEDIKQLRFLSKFNIANEVKILVTTILVFFAILILPLKDIYTYNRHAISYRYFKTNEINLMIDFVKRTAEGKTIYLFTQNPNPAIILMKYAHVNVANKMPGFWMLPGLLELSEKHKDDKDRLISMVTNTFKTTKPTLVIIEKSNYKNPKTNSPFRYTQYFSQNPEFKAIWSHYHFIYQINDYAFFIRGAKKPK